MAGTGFVFRPFSLAKSVPVSKILHGGRGSGDVTNTVQGPTPTFPLSPRVPGSFLICISISFHFSIVFYFFITTERITRSSRFDSASGGLNEVGEVARAEHGPTVSRGPGFAGKDPQRARASRVPIASKFPVGNTIKHGVRLRGGDFPSGSRSSTIYDLHPSLF